MQMAGTSPKTGFGVGIGVVAPSARIEDLAEENDTEQNREESCSRTTPTNHNAIRKWQQLQSARKPQSSGLFQPITIQTTSLLQYSGGPHSAPSSFQLSPSPAMSLASLPPPLEGSKPAFTSATANGAGPMRASPFWPPAAAAAQPSPSLPAPSSAAAGSRAINPFLAAEMAGGKSQSSHNGFSKPSSLEGSSVSPIAPYPLHLNYYSHPYYWYAAAAAAAHYSNFPPLPPPPPAAMNHPFLFPGSAATAAAAQCNAAAAMHLTAFSSTTGVFSPPADRKGNIPSHFAESLLAQSSTKPFDAKEVLGESPGRNVAAIVTPPKNYKEEPKETAATPSPNISVCSSKSSETSPLINVEQVIKSERPESTPEGATPSPKEVVTLLPPSMPQVGKSACKEERVQNGVDKVSVKQELLAVSSTRAKRLEAGSQSSVLIPRAKSSAERVVGKQVVETKKATQPKEVVTVAPTVRLPVVVPEDKESSMVTPKLSEEQRAAKAKKKLSLDSEIRIRQRLEILERKYASDDKVKETAAEAKAEVSPQMAKVTSTPKPEKPSASPTPSKPVVVIPSAPAAASEKPPHVVVPLIVPAPLTSSKPTTIAETSSATNGNTSDSRKHLKLKMKKSPDLNSKWEIRVASSPPKSENSGSNSASSSLLGKRLKPSYAGKEQEEIRDLPDLKRKREKRSSASNSFSEGSSMEDNPLDCTLRAEHLVEDCKVLLRRGVHFYLGKVKAISPPDVYGVILEGERGSKPHIYSREDLLEEGILEVQPESTALLREGSRVCVYWSGKYTYLFPGTIDEVQPDPDEPNHVHVELDDGDNRDIHIKNIRMLQEDYPFVEASDPSSTSSRLKRRISSNDSTSRLAYLPSSLGRSKSSRTSFEEVASSATQSPVPTPSLQSVEEVPAADEEDENMGEGGGHADGISALLPPNQLWNWEPCPNDQVKLVRGRRLRHCIVRGKDRLRTNDCAVFMSMGIPERPFIGRLEQMWETKGGKKRVRVQWFYHEEEVKGRKNERLLVPGGLFDSTHYDENDVQTISHKCNVLSMSAFNEMCDRDPSRLEKLYENNDNFYLAGHYDPVEKRLKMMPHVKSTRI